MDKRYRTNITLGIMLMTLMLGSSAWAQSIAIYPQGARLDHGEDPQRMVILKTREDGVTLDVTEKVTVTYAAEGLVKWGEDFKLHPVADGETTATFTYEGEALTIPVQVLNATTIPAMSFRNDVEPAIMRSGCNTGACHGSAKGKNGFRLSLFGFDSEYDYKSLTRELLARRINVAIPEESLMLQKPAGEVAHEGGTVISREDKLYNAMRRWIAEGVTDDPKEVKTLDRIEILPPQAVLEGEGATQRFMVRALYSDGSDRDVTDLAVMSTSDELTLTIDDIGKTTAAQQGEVYIMARFGTFAVVSKVIVIPQGKVLQWPEDAQPKNYIDEFVFAKLKKLRIPPAVICEDHIFLRRAYLDIIGTLPTVEESTAFLNDAAPDKRDKLVDALLQRPEFSNVWAMKWAEVLRVATIANVMDPKGMHRYNDWLRQAITSNVPMDQLVRDLLSAEGGNFTNPASNYYLVERDPVMISENVAQVFMGIQLKCAQCHNHPFERWTMDDYYSFAAFFAQIGRKGSSDPREQIIFNSNSGGVKNINSGQTMGPKFLGGAVPEIKGGEDRRAVLAAWLTSPENPWFARNIANRVWDHYLGAGIVNPPDDVRVTNPPSNPELLDEIGRRMVEYNYDLRKLVRDICTSYTYQMSTQPREEGISDERNFAYAKLRRMTAEQMLDAICVVTDTVVKFPNLPKGARPAEVANGRSGIYFLDVFGRPARESVCTCDRSNSPTLAQSLHLINGDTMGNAIKSPEGRLARLVKAETPTEQVLEELYLASVSRKPTTEELATMKQHIDATEDKQAALEDVFWTMLNAKEFIFNH